MNTEGLLPYHGIFPITPCTPHLPGLITYLYVPGLGMVMWLVTWVSQGDLLLWIRAKIHNSPSGEVHVLQLRQSTFTPRANFKAKSIFLFTERTGNGGVTDSCLRQIGTVRPSIERGSDGHASPVLQSLPASLATLGPLWELGYNTIPRARNEASLLCGGLRGKVLTYFAGDHGPVQLLNTAHSPVLQPMLGRHALGGPRLGLAQDVGSKHTVVPVRDLPLEEVAVPVTDTEAASLLWRSVVLITAGQVTCPTFKVEAPQCPNLDSSRPTVSCTLSPGAYRQKNKVSVTQRLHATIHTKTGQSAYFSYSWCEIANLDGQYNLVIQKVILHQLAFM